MKDPADKDQGSQLRATTDAGLPNDTTASGNALRAHNIEILRHLARSPAETLTDRDLRRATLNLIEDSVAARRAAENETRERQRSELALLRSEERLQLALDAAAMGTFVWYVAEDRGEPDAQMVALFGNPADDMLTLKGVMAKLIHPDDARRYGQAMEHAVDPQGNGDLREDVRILLPDGSLRWLAVTAKTHFVGEPRIAVHMAGAAIDITARKATEEALRLSEERQAFLLRLSDALRPLTDHIEIQGEISRVVGEYFGVTRACYADVDPDGNGLTVARDYILPGNVSGVGRYMLDDFGPKLAAECRAGRTLVVAKVDDDSRLTETERSVCQTIGIAAFCNVPVLKDGRLVSLLSLQQSFPRLWTAAEIALIEDAAGRTWAAVDRVRAEAALREAESRNRIAMEATGMATWDYDVRTGHLLWNEQHYQLLGLPPDGESKTLDDFLRAIHPDDLQTVSQELHRAVHETGSYEAEFRIVRADGVVRWMSGFGRATEKSGDRALRMTGVMFDVTERYESGRALRDSQERLRLIVENAREYAIFTMDLDRRVTSWNPGAERLLGYEEKEIVGESADVIFTSEDRAAGGPEQEAGTALKEGRSSDERWHVRKDRSKFWGSGAMMAMRDPGGTALGLLKIFRDQTAEMQARQRLEQSQADLWEALQQTELARESAEAAKMAKDHFLAVLSHELRTPLTPVLMATHIFLRRKDLPEEVGEALEMINRNIRLEVKMIDDLLDVTRIERGKMELQIGPVNLHDVVRRAVEVSSSDIESKRQRLTVTLQAAQDAVEGDALRLQQAFWNLLKNASKFTPEGGEIQVASRSGPGSIVITVTDSGIGFPPEMAEQIFTAFQQAEMSVTQQFGGLGLGLAIAKATITGHGGTLRAESEGRNSGAKFTVELPVSGETKNTDEGETGARANDKTTGHP